jgi:branched-chain amino acid transport system substrate-binding protein
MKKVLMVLLMASLAAGLILGCSGGDQGKKGDTLRIGALYPLSGNLAALGTENFRGAELAVKVKNAAGGIGGKKIELVKADAPDATAAVSEADRLISKEGLKAIIGTYSSSLSFAASEVAERNGVIYWEVGGISDPITSRSYKYLFRTVPTASSYGIYGVRFAKAIAPKLGKKPEDLKIAVIGEDSMYGTTCGDWAEKEAAAQGMKIAARIRYSAKTNDLSAVVLKLKDVKPDILIHTSYITDTILFFRQAKELGLNMIKAYIGQGGGYALRDFADAMGDEVNGIFNVDYPQVDLNPKFAKGIDEFNKLYKETYGSEPKSAHSLVAYQGTLLLLQAIEKGGGQMNADAIRKGALEINIPDGETAAGYGAKFEPSNPANMGQNTAAFPLVSQWQNNRQITVWPEKYAATDKILLPQKPWKTTK